LPKYINLGVGPSYRAEAAAEQRLPIIIFQKLASVVGPSYRAEAAAEQRLPIIIFQKLASL